MFSERFFHYKILRMRFFRGCGTKTVWELGFSLQHEAKNDSVWGQCFSLMQSVTKDASESDVAKCSLWHVCFLVLNNSQTLHLIVPDAAYSCVKRDLDYDRMVFRALANNSQ